MNANLGKVLQSKGMHGSASSFRTRAFCSGVWFVSMVILLVFGVQVAAFAAGSFKQGMLLYKKKDYPNALKSFQKALPEDPYSAELHYYLGNTYVFLGKGEEAMKEYSQSFDLEPLSTFGQYSRQALMAFGKKFKGFYSASTDGKKHVAPDDSKSIKQALTLIKGQTCDREGIHHGQAETAAKSAVAAGEDRDHRIGKAAQELVEDLTPVNKSPSPALQEELHEIQQRAVFEGQRARLNAQQEAAKHMAAAAERSTHVETSASSLLALISENPRPGHVKVKAAGTNLYVRNYDFEAAPPLEPLLASWQLLPELEQNGEEQGKLKKIKKAKPLIQKPSTTNKSKSIVASSVVPAAKGSKRSAGEKMDSEAVSPSGGKPWETVFVPGASKVMVTDSNGRVLLHLRDDGNK